MSEDRTRPEDAGTWQEEREAYRREIEEIYAELERTNQGVVALYAEIDEKNLQLRNAVESRARFMRSISHELRTPVNSILGLARLLLDPMQTQTLNPEQTEQVEFVLASATDLSRLVDELLALAKAEAGHLAPQARTFSLRELLAELGSVVEPLLRDGVTLEIETHDDDQVRTDPDLLRHVLRNLMSNAAKFTVDGHVRVDVGRDEAGRLEIAVADTGIGISQDDLAKVFEEFYQARSPLHSGAGGTGLGLPFAQLVAHSLGGEVTASSTVGVGSTFRVVLPDTQGDDDA